MQIAIKFCVSCPDLTTFSQGIINCSPLGMTDHPTVPPSLKNIYFQFFLFCPKMSRGG